MSRQARARLVQAACGVALLAGCSEQTSGAAQSPAGPATPTEPLKVEQPLDPAAYTENPDKICALVPASLLSELGLKGAGEAIRSDVLDLCGWSEANGYLSAAVSGHKTEPRGLDAVYEQHGNGEWETFSELTVSGYPAVKTTDHGTAGGFECQTIVGIADTLTVIVSASRFATDEASGTAANQAANAAVTQLEKSN